jgi:hypothetical protein
MNESGLENVSTHGDCTAKTKPKYEKRLALFVGVFQRPIHVHPLKLLICCIMMNWSLDGVVVKTRGRRLFIICPLGAS